MRALVTGMNGTVAPALARLLEDEGHGVVPWDRSVIPTDEEGAIRAFIDRVAPDAFFHIATGDPQWAERVARHCASAGIPFLFTSSVSVYADHQRGPFTIHDEPAPDDEYGRYKLEVERRVGAAHPAAHIARIGWQIGTAPGGNQMVDYLDRKARDEGRIEASRRWVPACSFLADTARSLLDLLAAPPGLYHVDGNPGLSFYEIVCGLRELTGAAWEVAPSEQPQRDNRLIDPRVTVRPISDWFGG